MVSCQEIVKQEVGLPLLANLILSYLDQCQSDFSLSEKFAELQWFINLARLLAVYTLEFVEG
jgi:hypothetical protein